MKKTVIPTFHWTTFPLRSWRSRSFSKIIPNRSRSVDSHTIWGLHASSTLPLRFYNASVMLLPRYSRFGCVVIALLLRSRYDNEDPAMLSLRSWLRACYDIGRRSYVFVALLCHFYIKSEVYSSGNKELASLIHNYLCVVLKLLQIIRPSE